MAEINYKPMFDTVSTGHQFLTHAEAFNWAADKAARLGFYITRTSKKWRTTTLFDQYFKCECAGSKRIHKKPPSSKSVRRTSTKKIGCMFSGSIKCKEDGFWQIDIISGYHNHPLVVFKAGHCRETRLDEIDKAKVQEMTRAHCLPKKIIVALEKSNPGKPYVTKTVYNHRQRMKAEEKCGRNTAQQFLQVSRLRKYFTRFIPEPKTDRLIALFWANPVAIRLLRTYPHVLCIDATYGTNRYNFSLIQIIGVTPTNKNFTAAQALLDCEDKQRYMWTLQCLKLLLGDVQPNAIVTDRELGLFEPIQVVFPSTRHILCLHHIKKNIRAKAITQLGNVEEADRLMYGKVYKMIESPTIQKFEFNDKAWRSAIGWKQSFVKYMDDTWMCHKEKFVRVWTNQVMHYGNDTTNRVESAHRGLKRWLTSCRGSLDTLFEEVHEEIMSQIKEIDKELEWSRTKSLVGYDIAPYKFLQRQVSHYCLCEMEEELVKTKQCTHAVSTTHGMPCQCLLRVRKKESKYILATELSSFWRTLVYEGQEKQVASNPYDLHLLMQEVYARDHADHPRFGAALREALYPDECNYNEPNEKESKKGRPRKKAKITRELSYWEHVNLKYPRKGKIRGSRAEDESDEEQCNHIAVNNLPPFLRQYILSIDDVNPDGNCGFRCAALKFNHSEEVYRTVRQQMFTEVGAHPEYKSIYGGQQELERAMNRIGWFGNYCDQPNWMCTSDLFAMAQVYRAVVSVYCFKNDNDTSGSGTFLPWRGELCDYETLLEISIIYMESRRHFVLATFREGSNHEPDHPLPPIDPVWRFNCSNSLRLLEERYGSRLERYKSLAIASGFVTESSGGV